MRPYEAATRARFNMDTHYYKFPLDQKGQEIMPFCVGSCVLCGGGGQLGEIASSASGVYATKLGYANAVGGCTVSFEAEGEQVLIPYSSIGRGKGGARLRRPPASLRPADRVKPSFAYTSALKERVLTT